MSPFPKVEEVRKADHPIEPIFLRRWSPRALTGESISEAEMLTLFEAARWPPSTYNEQEWRFVYARRDTPQWPRFFELLGRATAPGASVRRVVSLLLNLHRGCA